MYVITCLEEAAHAPTDGVISRISAAPSIPCIAVGLSYYFSPLPTTTPARAIFETVLSVAAPSTTTPSAAKVGPTTAATCNRHLNSGSGINSQACVGENTLAIVPVPHAESAHAIITLSKFHQEFHQDTSECHLCHLTMLCQQLNLALPNADGSQRKQLAPCSMPAPPACANMLEPVRS